MTITITTGGYALPSWGGCTYTVTGMTYAPCVVSVTEVISELDPQTNREAAELKPGCQVGQEGTFGLETVTVDRGGTGLARTPWVAVRQSGEVL